MVSVRSCAYPESAVGQMFEVPVKLAIVAGAAVLAHRVLEQPWREAISATAAIGFVADKLGNGIVERQRKAELRADLAAWEDDTTVKGLRQDIANLTQEKSEAERLLAAEKVVTGELQGQVGTLTSEKSEVERQLREVREGKVDVEGQLATARREKGEVEVQRDQFQRERGGFERQAGMFKADKERLEGELRALRTGPDGEIFRLQEAARAKDLEIQALTGDKNEAERQLRELQGQAKKADELGGTAQKPGTTPPPSPGRQPPPTITNN